MNYAAALSPAIALLGVWIGGRLSFRTQEKAWKQAEVQKWREIRRSAYGDFITTARRYRTYIGKTNAANIRIRHFKGAYLDVDLDDEGVAHKRDLDAALAQVQLMADDQGTVYAARALVGMTRRFAAGKGVYRTQEIPPEYITEAYWNAELAFINATRTEFGMSSFVPGQYVDPNASLDQDIHAEFVRAQRDGRFGRPA